MWNWVELTKFKWNHSIKYYTFLELILQFVSIKHLLELMKISEHAPEPWSKNMLQNAFVIEELLVLARGSKIFSFVMIFVLFLWSLLNFTYWFPLKYQPVNGGAFEFCYFQSTLFKTLLWPWPSIHILFYYAWGNMHTFFKCTWNI